MLLISRVLYVRACLAASFNVTIISLGRLSPNGSCSGEEEDVRNRRLEHFAVHVSFLPSHLAPPRVCH